MDSLISIIVPVYNAQNTLNKCVDSLLNQIYKNIEIILIDDGSKDQSGQICDDYSLKDNRIKTIHKSNGGVSSARNRGFEKATGEYILCVDSDDYVDDSYVQIFVDAKNKFPEYGNYWCGIKMINMKDNSIHEYVADTNEEYSFYDRKDIQTITTKLLGLSPYGRFYKRELIVKNHLRMNESISLGEDAIFNYDYLDINDNSSILIINQTPYNYIRGINDTLDTKYYKNLYDIFQTNNTTIESYLNKWDVDQSQMILFNNSRFYNYERVLNNTFRKECTLTLFDRLKYNSKIMRSKEFKNTLKNFTDYMHPLYKCAYKTNHYIFVLLVNKLVNIKNILRK